MPFGFWVLGNIEEKVLLKVLVLAVSNAFRLLGSGELGDAENRVKLTRQISLKCLSAFGFWGTENAMKTRRPFSSCVSNAFRLLGSGEPSTRRCASTRGRPSQMPFGFWVLGNRKILTIRFFR